MWAVGYDFIIRFKVKFTLEQAVKAQRGEWRYTSTPFFNLGARSGWVANATPRPSYPREKNSVLIVQKAGWATGPVWTDAKSLSPRLDSIPGPSSP